MTPIPLPATEVTDATQAIRLATTMTGGVSLAIWMGGVAREIDLLTQASQWRRKNSQAVALPALPDTAEPAERVRGLYLGLLNLLDVLVDTDILSGTSAGGINAGLLAYSRVQQKDLGTLRDIWLDVGSLLTLLREPYDKDVPSLLLGDEQMYGQLKAKLANLPDVDPDFKRDKAAASTTLFVTTTLLSGETSRFTDDYGTLVQDVDHHGLFRFTEKDLAKPGAPSALALAARSSASFPAAFEPSFIPFGATTKKLDKVPARPDMAPFTDFTRSHWAADGGLLNNRPIGPLLQAVFDRPATREVRRILLYIVPSAGDSPDPLAPEPGDDVSKPYGLAEGLFKELGAVLKQSITSDLRTIREHNDKVRVRTDVRLQIADFAKSLPADGSILSDRLLADYRAREADLIAGPIVEAMMRQLSTWPKAGKKPMEGSIPERWDDDLKPGGNAELKCRKAIVKHLTKIWDCQPVTPAKLASYGRPAFDGATATAIAIVRTALQAQPTPTQRRSLAELSSAVHAAFVAGPRPDVRECVSAELAVLTGEGHSETLEQAAALIAEHYFAKLSEPKAPEETQTSTERFQLAQTVARVRERLRRTKVPEAVPAPPEAPLPPLGEQAWQALGQAFIANTDLLVALATASPAAPDAEPGAEAHADPDADADAEGHAEPDCDHVLTPGEKLEVYRGYLKLENPADVAKRLFDLYAVQRAMLPLSADVDQPVELIQVSADTRTLLNLERKTAASKLTGEQLHHFGAFFKQSWRANDWMWGRLDGAGWLVHLLLDPRRIQVMAQAQPAGASRVDWFLGKLTELGIPAPPAAGSGVDLDVDDDDDAPLDIASIRAELAFLDATDAELPPSLPLTAMWVAKELQLDIAVDELPELAHTVVKPQNDGNKGRDPKNEHISAVSRQWAGKVLKPAEKAEIGAQKVAAAEKLRDDAPDLLRTCPIPDETLQGELGTPLMVRTIAKAAADATAALNSVKQIPGVIRPVFSWARTVTLAGYRLTNKTNLRARTMIPLGALLLVGGIIAAAQQAVLWGIGGAIVASVGGYLLVFGAWQTSRLVLFSVLSATLVFGAAALTLPSTRRGLFGTSESDPGWLGRNVHWLALSGWHPLIALGILLLVIAALALVLEAVGRRHRHTNIGLWNRINHSPPAIVGYVVALAVIAGACVAWICVYHDQHPKKGPQDSAVGIAVLKSVTDSAAGLPAALEGLDLQLAKSNPSTTDTLKAFTNAFLTEFGQNLAGKSEGPTGAQVQGIIQAFAKAPPQKPADAVTKAACTAINAGLSSPATKALTTSHPQVAAALSMARAKLAEPAKAPACQQVASWLVSLMPSVTPEQASAAISLAASAALADAKP